jgi:hypothetical protein
VVFDGAGDVLCTGGSSAVKLDPSGVPTWHWRARVTGDTRVGAVTVDTAGRLLVAGSYRGTYDFGDGPRDSGSRPALFIVALAP